jgi:hypothetical protein
MFDSFSSPLRGHHETLHQSVENPVRADRLPDGTPASIEHRTRVIRGADRRQLIRTCLWQIAWRVAAPAAACLMFLQDRTVWVGAGDFWLAVLMLVGLLGVLGGLLAERSWQVRWSAYLGAFVAILPTLVLDRPYYDLGLAILAITILADRIATHAFYAATSHLDQVRVRRRERLRWQNRFRIFDHPSRTISGYPLAVGAPLVIYALTLWWRSGPALVVYFDDLRLLFQGFLLLLLIAFVGEPLIAFMFGRPVLSPRRLVAALRSAIVDWLSYNHREIRHPGIFQSPGGRLSARASLFFGALLALAVGVLHLSAYFRADYSAVFAEPSEEHVSDSLGSPPPLEPYQQAMLERLPPAEQAEFLEQFRQQNNVHAEEESQPTGPGVDTFFLPGSNPTSQRDFHDLQIRTSLLGLAAMTGPIWLKALALTPGLLLLPLYLIASLLPAVARAYTAAPPAKAGEQPLDELKSEDWNRFVDGLRRSPDPIERKSVFLGLNAEDYSPVIVPRRVFDEHAHILGDSGSGKTALGLAPLISQLIRAQDCSVVVIDLKGDDHALFENCRLEAEQAGMRFRWFSNELGQATFAYNPLLQAHLRELSLYQRTDLLTASLGLQYGTDYGRGYFSDANAELLYHALRARPEIQSFIELAGVLKQREPFRTVSAQLKTAGSHLAAIVTRLGATEALNAVPSKVAPEVLAHAIDMRQPFEEPQVIYFHLSSALGTATTAEIARMAMFSLLSAAKFVSRDRRQVYLIVDEFQRVVSNNLELFLQTARSMKIGVILANQSLGDLKKPDADIVSTVRTNTRFRQLFAVGEMHDLQEAILTSGETLIHNRSWSENIGMAVGPIMGRILSRSFSETTAPRLRVNDLLLASDHPLQSVVQVRRGDGYAQYGGMPFVMNSAYHISPEEYEIRRSAAWPENVPGTFTPTLATTDPVAFEQRGAPDQKSGASPSLVEFLRSLDTTYEMQKATRHPSPDPTTEDSL